jgi:hypothetical protein
MRSAWQDSIGSVAQEPLHSLELHFQRPGDFVHRTRAVNDHKFLPLRVVIDHRSGLLLVHPQPMVDDLPGVLGTPAAGEQSPDEFVVIDLEMRGNLYRDDLIRDQVATFDVAAAPQPLASQLTLVGAASVLDRWFQDFTFEEQKFTRALQGA